MRQCQPKGGFHCPFGPSQLRRLGPNGPRNTAIMGALPRAARAFGAACPGLVCFALSALLPLRGEGQLDQLGRGEVRKNVFSVIVVGSNATIERLVGDGRVVFSVIVVGSNATTYRGRQHLAAFASRLPPRAERQQQRARAGIFTAVFAEVMAILWLKKGRKHAYGGEISFSDDL